MNCTTALQAAWHIEVDRQNPAVSRLVEQTREPEMGEHSVRLRVERLALTANVLTYALSGDAFGFWQLFPAESGWGRIPAWGHAVVERSMDPKVHVGERYFGMLPMASHWTLTATRSRLGLRDDSAHRASLNPVYNQYALSEEVDPSVMDREALFRPLLITSFVLEQHLLAQSFFAASEVWISSASSKTALGLAERLQGLLPVRGLTSAGNLPFVQRTECYDTVHDFAVPAQAAEASKPASVVLVDFSGDDRLVTGIALSLGPRLLRVLRVGSTHWQRAAILGSPEWDARLPIPQESFFGPDHIVRLIGDWGPREFESRLQAVLAQFSKRAESWYETEAHHGSQGMQTAYTRLASGQLPPDRLCIVRPT